MQTTKITKTACFTDIHWGKRNNSAEHNQDCLDFIDWFCAKVTAAGDISHIVFLGDWFENRAAINILTLEMSYQGAKKLNDLGIPIIHIVGNHDLHRRSTREIHSVNMFNEFKNFIVVEQPMVIGGSLFLPFLFDDEYTKLAEYNETIPYWYGHLEFRNFYITGYNMVMEHGPDHTNFSGPKKIFSGHFHKRQANDNVVYIGNTFPMDFGDAGDTQRGMMFCDHEADSVEFEDWDDCPTFLKTTLSKVLAEDWKPKAKMRVQCLVDVELTYSDAQLIRETMIDTHSLREFSLEENVDAKKDALGGDEDDDEEADGSQTIDEFVVKSLSTISDVKNIDNNKLIKIYLGLA